MNGTFYTFYGFVWTPKHIKGNLTIRQFTRMCDYKRFVNAYRDRIVKTSVGYIEVYHNDKRIAEKQIEMF